MTKKYSLPSRIGGEEIIDFVEQAAFHPGSTETELKKWLANPGEIASTRRSCLTLGLTEEALGRVEPTDLGRRLVYAEKADRQDLMLQDVILGYEPYEIPLTQLMRDRGEPFDLTPADLQRNWTLKFRLGLSKDSLDRAATTLLKLLDYSGVGAYLVGRRGKPTRMEMAQEGFDRLSRAIGESQAKRREASLLFPDPSPVEPSSDVFASSANVGKPQRSVFAGPSLETPSAAEEGYQVHRSRDGSVILWIKPSNRAIGFLESLLPVLEYEAQETPQGELSESELVRGEEVPSEGAKAGPHEAEDSP